MNKKVPDTIKGCGSPSSALMHERRLLAKREMLRETAQKKYWELEAIFQMIFENDQKIEDQRKKQTSSKLGGLNHAEKRS